MRPIASRNTITRLILEKMSELGGLTLDAFFPRYYSYTRISRLLFGLDKARKISPRTLSTLLSRLQKQGLVARSGVRRKSSWVITEKGRMLLQKENSLTTLIIPPRDDIIRLVIFDIPEHDRKKRDLLRVELTSYNFSQFQKSVWIGHNPLPEEFIEFLDAHLLEKKVHIFS